MTVATEALHAEVEEVRSAAGSIRIAGVMGGADTGRTGPWRLRLTSRERARIPFARRIVQPVRPAYRDYEVTVDGRRFAAEIRIAGFALGRSLPYEHWDAHLIGPDVSLPLGRHPNAADESFPAQTTAAAEPVAICPLFEHGTLAIRCQRLQVPKPYDRSRADPY